MCCERDQLYKGSPLNSFRGTHSVRFISINEFIGDSYVQETKKTS